VQNAAPDLYRSCQLVVSRAAGPVDRMLPEIEPMLAAHGSFIIYKGPNYSEEEHEAALAVAEQLRLRFVAVNAIQLEDDDPERLFVIFDRGA
jgi:16S rRNA G527 N7-methylase RsmG